MGRGNSPHFLADMKYTKDQMTGNDLIQQENYEFGLEQKLVDSMDRVDRRDKRGEIRSMVSSSKYRNGYDKIIWTNSNNNEV